MVRGFLIGHILSFPYTPPPQKRISFLGGGGFAEQMCPKWLNYMIINVLRGHIGFIFFNKIL